jgi:hypothetical protein
MNSINHLLSSTTWLLLLDNTLLFSSSITAPTPTHYSLPDLCKGFQKSPQSHLVAAQLPVMRQKNMVMSPMGPRTKNNCTDKGQQKFIQLTNQKQLTLKMATAIFAKISQTFNILHGAFLKAEVIQLKCILTELLKYFSSNVYLQSFYNISHISRTYFLKAWGPICLQTEIIRGARKLSVSLSGFFSGYIIKN